MLYSLSLYGVNLPRLLSTSRAVLGGFCQSTAQPSGQEGLVLGSLDAGSSAPIDLAPLPHLSAISLPGTPA